MLDELKLHYVHYFLADCPELSSPANGMVSITGQMSGDTATYTCDSGYELLDLTTGGDMRTCQPDGMWSGSESQCVSKSSYKSTSLFIMQACCLLMIM